MKQNFFLATGVAALLAFSSCKKEDKGNPAPNNPGTATKQLKKVTKTEAGVTTVYNLTYDASKRLTSYKTADNSEFVIFTYDANGNLSGIEQKDDEYKNVYVYNFVNNVPVSAVFKSWELTDGQPTNLIEDDKLTYTVTNGQVSKIKLEMLQDDAEMNLLLSYANGNLTKVTTEGMDVYTATFTYGNKRPAFPKVTNWVLDQAGFSLQFGANNDLRSRAYDFPGTAADKTINITYTYDNDGYVLTSTDGSEQLVYEYQ